jgi:hypothetical protein
MFLFALEDTDVVRFAAIVGQLKNEIDNGHVDANNFTKDDLLNYFAKNDINLDITDVYDMIQKPPLNTLVKNIQGDKVVFVGMDNTQPANPDQSQSQQVVQQMAQSAMK